MNHRKLGPFAVLAAAALLAPVLAADRATSPQDRLFLSFIEDATYTDGQWWEGQLELSDGEFVDSTVLRGVVALKIRDRVEVGGRVGFGDTDAPGGAGGNGATDLDLWGKYHFGTVNDRTEFSAGAIATVPTGDEDDGLGTDAFSVAAFGAVRHRLNRAILTGNVGVRVNGDAQPFGGPDVDGETSPFLGAGVIVPLSDRVAFVGEGRWEDGRFDGADSDARLLGGLNWRVSNVGQLRTAIAVGLDDGAPDGQVLVGYAAQF